MAKQSLEISYTCAVCGYEFVSAKRRACPRCQQAKHTTTEPLVLSTRERAMIADALEHMRLHTEELPAALRRFTLYEYCMLILRMGADSATQPVIEAVHEEQS